MKRKGGSAPRNPKEPVVRAAFARVLADLREKAGLTQEQVAEKSGYEEKYIGALERRKHTPTLTAVIQISNAVKGPARSSGDCTLLLRDEVGGICRSR